jgi:hypothetical protein
MLAVIASHIQPTVVFTSSSSVPASSDGYKEALDLGGDERMRCYRGVYED